MKIVEVGGKFGNKLSECKIVMMRFEKKMSIERNGAFLPKLVISSIGGRTGMEERMKLMNICP